MKSFTAPRIEVYCEQHSTRPGLTCDAIEANTQAHFEMSQMLVGKLEGSLLGFLVSLTQAKRVLEIGCFTGYSALCMAERLPSNGELITLDVNKATVKAAQTFWQQSPHGKKIKPRLGPALDTLKKLAGPFDLIFIDADKTSYPHYLKASLELLSPQGVIVVDNCLWSGRVLEPGGDEDTRALKQFNQTVARDPTLEKVLLPLRDGVFLIRKRTL